MLLVIDVLVSSCRSAAVVWLFFFFFSSRRRHTRCGRDWSSDVCSSDLAVLAIMAGSTWIIRLIPAYLLAITFGLGVPGAWVAAIFDINSRALMMFLRFRQGRWKEIKV